MHQNCSSHSSWGAVLTSAGQMAALAAVMLLLNQVIPRSEGDQMSVVCGSGDGDGACAADVCVTQLVGQLLELVSIKMIIIPEHVIVAGAGGALDTLMRAEIEVKLRGVSDTNVDGGTSGDVPGLAALLLLVRAEQTGVVTLLDHDEGDSRLVVGFQLDTSFSNGCEFVLQNVHELSLTNSISVYNYPMRFVSSS